MEPERPGIQGQSYSFPFQKPRPSLPLPWFISPCPLAAPRDSRQSSMVLMAAASDDHHHRRRHRAAKRSLTPPQPESPSPAPAPLDCFSFTWGVRRRLRCSKDGAPVTATALPSPPQQPVTPSPDKEKTPQGDAAGSSSRPQRSRYLRPLRYTATNPASRSTDAGAGQALHSPASAPPAPPTEPQQPRKRGFAVALTKQEIARDFAAVRCKRPPRRGKKRSKAQQAKIDALCPGFFLSTVDLDNYKIDDNNNR
ncbi:hypothetical protein CFC21_008677 [Triticum aestivum]|uniref:Uncharacterized protein n=3 Tax=Triticum TaxID=4564 RepID=A0A9R0R3B3_TRITD|nr:predicted GPI-anchored protein 58 [Triticum aestivum]KAF6991607.1 hypothetical protein CFC21_008677 [Triticum aestivum]VAH22313.1 unnamed protein product [Triticum turgidum subsp. durum]